MRRLSQEEIELAGGHMSADAFLTILGLSAFLLILLVLYTKYRRG